MITLSKYINKFFRSCIHLCSLLLLSFTLSFISCSGVKGNKEAETNAVPKIMQTQDCLRGRVRFIYEMVLERHQSGEDFLSATLKSLMEEKKSTSQGQENSIADYNIWMLSSAAPIGLQWSIAEVKLLSSNRASANVYVSTLKKEGETSREFRDIQVTLIFERGDWYVDNIASLEEDLIRRLSQL